MDAKQFEKRTGRPPQDDDLERVNCDEAGSPGHTQCGWCGKHDAPFCECLCVCGYEAQRDPRKVDQKMASLVRKFDLLRLLDLSDVDRIKVGTINRLFMQSVPNGWKSIGGEKHGLHAGLFLGHNDKRAALTVDHDECPARLWANTEAESLLAGYAYDYGPEETVLHYLRVPDEGIDINQFRRG